MKKKDVQKLHQSSTKELSERLTQARKKLVDLRMASGREKTKDVRTIAKKRDEVATIATILREKQFLEEVKPSSTKEKEGKEKDEKV